MTLYENGRAISSSQENRYVKSALAMLGNALPDDEIDGQKNIRRKSMCLTNELNQNRIIEVAK